MNQEFNSNIPIFNVIYKLVLLILLGILWISCSLPIITIGSATTALYYAVVKSVRHERGHAFTSFFHSFRINFSHSILPTILYIGLLGLLLYGFLFLLQLTQEYHAFLFAPYLLIIPMLPLILILPYYFPVYSRFELPFSAIIRNCLYYSIRHFASTVLFLVLIAGSLFITFQYPYLAIFVPGILCWVISLRMEKILILYTPKSIESSDNSELPWYLE